MTFPDGQLELFSANDGTQTSIEAPELYLGCLDWRRPAWGELIWPAPVTAEQLELYGLADYARHPAFSAVCLQSGSEPLESTRLHRYAQQSPPGLAVLLAAPDSLCAPRVATSHRVNQNFLEAGHFVDDIWKPAHAAFAERLRLVVLRFQRLRNAGIPALAFGERLQRFLERLPPEIPLAVELADARYLTSAYDDALRAHHTVHVLSNAPQMPPFSQQMAFAQHGRSLAAILAHPPHSPHGSVAEQHFGILRCLRHGGRRPTYVLMDDLPGATAPALVDSFRDLILEYL